MAGQRPWARETPSGVTERGATELYGTGGRGLNTQRRSGERTPTPPQPPRGAGASKADRARGPRAPRPRRGGGQAPRPASRCPSQLLTRARRCAPGPPQPLRQLISQLFKSRAVSAPFSQEAGAPFPDERRRSDERLTATATRGPNSSSEPRVCRSSRALSVCPARGPPPPPGAVRSQLGARANEGGGAPRPPAGARVCGVWARGRRRWGRHKCAGRALRAPEAAAEAAPGSTGQARGAARRGREQSRRGRLLWEPSSRRGPSGRTGGRPA